MQRPSLFDAYTAHYHYRAVASFGVVSGVFLLNAEFARGTLGATEWQVLALLLVPALAQTAAVFHNPVESARHPFRRVAIPFHLLLLLPVLGLFPGGATAFVVLMAGLGALQMLLVPLQNGILARNYAPATRGRRLGRAHALQALAIAAVGLPAGYLLDHVAGSWRGLYAGAAVAAVYAYFQWAHLRQRRAVPAPRHLVTHRSAWATIRRDRLFLAFEACFMAYGLGFLMLQPVLPIYLIDDLGVSYAEAGLAKGLLFWLAMVLVGPRLGGIADRIGVLRLAAMAFGTLALFPLVLLTVPGAAGLYLGYTVFGLAMSGVFLAWTLGPIHLARGRDAKPYLNAHLGLVGVRALVGMLAGRVLQDSLGTGAVFVTVAALEIVAALGMLWTARAVERADAPVARG